MPPFRVLWLPDADTPHDATAPPLPVGNYLGFTVTDTPHLVGLLWPSDQPGSETST
jgi:hypothetical protein